MSEIGTNLVWSILGLPLGVASFLYSLFGGKEKIELQDKVVFLTGASGGLGEAIAEVLYDAGCKVILSGRQIKVLENVRDKLSSRVKANCHMPAIVQMDLENLSEIPSKIKEGLAAFGHIDILINNAGMSCRGWAHETKLDVDRKLLTTNYLGQVHLTKVLLPHMMERRSGLICCISSIQGKMGLPDRAAYSASKHALEGFFDSLRAELSTYDIDVSLVSSFYIRTNFSNNAICGDGTVYNKTDKNTATGLDPRYVARQILKCVVNRKEEHIIAPFYIHLAICLRFMAPWLFFKIMSRKAWKQIALNNKIH